MSDVKFTSDHEWIRIEGDIATVGITDHAQSQLGDVVFVELPKVGASVKKGSNAAVVESVKSASEVYAPLTGSVTEVNSALESDPGALNKDAEGTAWLMKIRISAPDETKDLLDRKAYDALVAKA